MSLLAGTIGRHAQNLSAFLGQSEKIRQTRTRTRHASTAKENNSTLVSCDKKFVGYEWTISQKTHISQMRLTRKDYLRLPCTAGTTFSIAA